VGFCFGGVCTNVSNDVGVVHVVGGSSAILFPSCFSRQVSNLVIAHEEAAEGGIAHDLTGPVAAVDGAVQNLVVVSLGGGCGLVGGAWWVWL